MDFSNAPEQGELQSENSGSGGLEFRACLLKGDDGRWVYCVVSNRADSDGVPDIISFNGNGHDTNDAAWLAAKAYGGRAIYLSGNVGQP